MSSHKGKIFTSGNVIDDKYVVLDFVGKGAFGEVYRAHQLNLQRDVAIKVVSQNWLRSLEVDEEEIETALQRFRREVQAMARVRHANVLQIYDHGSMVLKKNGKDYPVEFIVMEYIPGETMRHAMSEEGFYPEQELVKEWLQEYYLPVLDGVEAIHALDIVHRDLKPENILLDGKMPKIADFGLARSSRLKPVTQSMEVKGTAHYMSPEQFFDFRRADQHADIYALGKILFEAVAGKIGNGTIPFKTAALPSADTPFFRRLDQIIQDATAENKEDRLKTVDQLRRRLLDAIAELEQENLKSDATKPERLPILQHSGWIWVGIVIAVASVAAMTIWHMAGRSAKKLEITNRPQVVGELPVKAPEPTSDDHAINQQSPDQTVLTEDGATLHFIAGGEVSLPESLTQGSAKVKKVDAFYIDEAPVTNHQFVHFLNRNLSKLNVENDVVRQGDEIWLLIGEVFEGYAPIVFRDGNFDVSQATYASFPVLRVTGYGAVAYARFYGRRLPTTEEWEYAFGKNDKPEETPQAAGGSPEPIEMEKMHSQMMQSQEDEQELVSKNAVDWLSPVSNYPANKYGLRDMGYGSSEWSLLSITSGPEKLPPAVDYVLMPEGVPRKPWEAFSRAGFRTARNVQ